MVLHPQAVSLQAQAFATKDETAKKTALEALFRVLIANPVVVHGEPGLGHRAYRDQGEPFT